MIAEIARVRAEQGHLMERGHPLASKQCRDCDGTGYVLLEKVDLAESEIATEKLVCRCVLEALGETGNGW